MEVKEIWQHYKRLLEENTQNLGVQQEKIVAAIEEEKSDKIIDLLREEQTRLLEEKQALWQKLSALEAQLTRPAGRADLQSGQVGWRDLVDAPSAVAKPEIIKELQMGPDTPLFLMHRPASAQAIPFSLLYEGFGLFHDVEAGLHGPPTPGDYQFAVELCHVASAFYISEAERQSAVATELSDYLGVSLNPLEISLGKAGQPLMTDGTAIVMLKGSVYPFLWLKIKLELGQGGGDPLVEVAAYFTHFIQRNLFGERMLPGLVIEHFGCFLRISGIANVGANVALEPLTPALHLLDLRPHQPGYMEKLALTLKSLRLTSSSFCKGYQSGGLDSLRASPLPYSLQNRGDATQHGKDAAADFLGRAELNHEAVDYHWGELLHSFKKPLGRRLPLTGARSPVRGAAVPVSSAESATEPGTPVEEVYISSASGSDEALQSGVRSSRASSVQLPAGLQVQPNESVPQKLLYKLIAPDGTCSVMKYATRYSVEAHAALADQGLAPKLLGVRKLQGGWLQIHMELLDAPWCSLLELLQTKGFDVVSSAGAATQDALSRAHAIMLKEGRLVWGDARPSNIYLRRREDGGWDVRLIDFDWSGAEGHVLYPGYLNNQVPWAEGVASHKPVRQTHDIDLLKNRLQEEYLLLPAPLGTDNAGSTAAASSQAEAQSSKGSEISRSGDAETPTVSVQPPKPRKRTTPAAGKKGKKKGASPPTAFASTADIKRTALPAVLRRPQPQLRQHSWHMQAGAALAPRYFLV